MPAFARVAAKALVLLAGWLVASLPPLVGDRCCGGATAAASTRRSSPTRRRRPRAQRRPDDRARRGRGVAHRASVDRRDPDAERHGRHLDRQLHRRRPGRRLGARRRLHADGDGRRVPARAGPARRRARRARAGRCSGLALAAIWMRLGVAGAAPRLRVGRPSARSPPPRSSRARSSTPSWDISENRANSFSRRRRGGARAAFASRCASRRTWRPRIRGASISSAARCRSCGA